MLYRPISLWTWIFLVITLVQATAALAIEGAIYSIVVHNTRGPEDQISVVRVGPTALTLLILGFIYQLFILYDTLAQRNFIQVIGLCAYSGCLCVYTVLQIDEIKFGILVLGETGDISLQTWNSVRTLLTAISVITGVSTFLLCGSSWKLYEEFQWTIVQRLNADLRLQRRYLTFQIYLTLLKFDLFFFIGYLVQLTTIVADHHNTEYVLTIGVIPLTVLGLFASAVAVRRESNWAMTVIIISYFAFLAGCIFKIVREYTPSHLEVYISARNILTYFGTITMVLTTATIVMASACMRNFSKGLKPHVSSGSLARTLEEQYQMQTLSSSGYMRVQGS